MEKGMQKQLLIDVKEAFDSMDRNKAREKARTLLGNEAGLVLGFLDLYDLLGMEIAGEIIWPTKGGPQGDVIVPMLFIMYLNDILTSVVNGNPEVLIIAFVDDMLQQSKSIESLQTAFDQLIVELGRNNLEVNTRKCELISDNLNDNIVNPLSGVVIPTRDSAKYLGQNVDAEAGQKYLSVTSYSEKSLILLQQRRI